MSWTTPQEHIAAHCRGGRYDPAKSVDANISAYNLQCLIGMIEAGEIAYGDGHGGNRGDAWGDSVARTGGGIN